MKQKQCKNFQTPSHLEYKVRTRLNGLTKYILVSLTTLVITMGSGWFLVGKELAEVKAAVVTEEEIVKIVQTRSPYLEDRALLTHTRRNLLKDMRDDIKEVLKSQQEFEKRLSRIEGRLKID